MLYSSFIKDSTRLLEYWRFELVAHTFQAVPSQEPRNSKLPGLRAHTSLVLGLRVQGLGFKVRGGFLYCCSVGVLYWALRFVGLIRMRLGLRPLGSRRRGDRISFF